MKLSRIKSVFLALSATLILAVLCFGLLAVNGGKAYAETADGEVAFSDARDLGGLSLGKYEGNNFVYSAEFDNAKEVGLVFGVADGSDSYWSVVVDISNGTVKLSHSEDGELKTASCDAGEQFKMTVVVNGGIVRVFIDNKTAAVITCRIDNYNGGKLRLSDDGFNVSNVKFTDLDVPEGDIYCNGFEVLKVVNITDGNRKLSSGEYEVKGGILTVSREYLRTLEANTEYVFRAVTSFTDFDFKVTTDFTAVTVTPAVEKYYKDNDVTLELSGNVTVHKLLIDGKECAFTQTDDAVLISSQEISALSTGKHSVKLYTDKGRPETSITVSETVETITEPEVKASHVFLWIDLAIFLSAIVGYTAYSIISKRKKK